MVGVEGLRGDPTGTLRDMAEVTPKLLSLVNGKDVWAPKGRLTRVTSVTCDLDSAAFSLLEFMCLFNVTCFVKLNGPKLSVCCKRPHQSQLALPTQ